MSQIINSLTGRIFFAKRQHPSPSEKEALLYIAGQGMAELLINSKLTHF